MHVRVVTGGRSLPSVLRDVIQDHVQGPFEFQAFDAPQERWQREADGALLDLLYVPSGEALEAEEGFRFAACSTAARLGVVSDDLGVVETRAGASEFQRFFRSRGPQDDVSTYEAGARYRTTSESESIDVPLPKQVYLGLTQRCNRSCTFCVSRTFDFSMLSVETVERLTEELGDAVEVIALTGAGEAMVHPEFWTIMDLLHERLPNARFKMNTSGLALASKAERLLRYPIKNITISLNAGTEATYERVVGKNFRGVVRGIEQLVSERVAAGREDLRTCLSMVLMNSTLPELTDVVTMAFELGVEEAQGIYLMINDDNLADESPWHQPERSNEHLERARRQAEVLGVELSLPPPFRSRESAEVRHQLASLPTSQGQRCVEPWSTTYVRPDGEVLPCPYFERSLGSLHEQSLEQVWAGGAYQGLRRSLETGQYVDECRHCCGFNESGNVDDYRSHWLGTRRPGSLPLVSADL